MRPIIIIPARLAAQRLPNKPLADIHGRSMIEWVWQRAVDAKIARVVVAAGDPEIVAVIEAAGGEAVLTPPGLPSGTDRVAYALAEIDPDEHHDIIVNLQGDLPNIESKTLVAVIDALHQVMDADITTPAAIITREEELHTNSVVKIAAEIAPGETTGRAVYFSRNLIPSGDGPHYHHIGVYAFRRHALERFMKLPPSGLALRENLEQLRALADGMHIEMVLVDQIPQPVDTAEDLARVKELLK
ncbi:MAG TPA: 3-deoxy-manno-octulosonate cytidylyltransferase [Alphaproteobacteria bacterium]|nr:3-deoxy-manno-octulosonate cytidylyltransferase [Rhodospirillaceae bacterium]HRJ13248.1 3-deoxy-manno-octulosonate cytidylyltransferase [Alphaproteobacteria bacterium]